MTPKGNATHPVRRAGKLEAVRDRGNDGVTHEFPPLVLRSQNQGGQPRVIAVAITEAVLLEVLAAASVLRPLIAKRAQSRNRKLEGLSADQVHEEPHRAPRAAHAERPMWRSALPIGARSSAPNWSEPSTC